MIVQTFILKLFKVLFSATLAFITTYTLVPILIALAQRFGIVDAPNGSLKRHAVVTPYLGGVAVYAGFLAGIALVVPVENRVLFLLIGSTLLLLLGLIDDLVALTPYQKFIGQILATLCFLKGGLFLKDQFFYNHFWVVFPISMLWCLTIINGFNLIDVMDGLATTVALGCAMSYLVISLLFDQFQTTVLLVAFMSALAAFLWFNKPRAIIYLGDAGALFIGGFLSALPFFFPWSTLHTGAFITPVLILGIPLFEIASLVVIRTWKKIPFYRGSPDHFCHYLQRWGLSVPSILVVAALANLALLGTAILYIQGTLSLAFMAIVAIVLFATWMTLVMRSAP